MEYTSLGRTSAKVSRLGLGTMNFGPVITEAESVTILDRAIEAGINLVDTADVYGSGPFGDDYGLVEKVIGRWLASRGAATRDRVVLATKFKMPMGTGPNDQGVSALYIRRAAEASLQRLQTDHIDLYHMHYLDRAADPAEVFEAFSVLRQQGKVTYFGSSNFSGWEIARYQEYANRWGMLGLVAEQAYYNLSHRLLELEVLPAAQHYGLGVIIYSPLGDGLLGGMLAKTDPTRSKLHLGKLTPERQARVERYEAYARDRGIPPAELAIAWLLRRPGVTCPIVGPRTMEHLEGALRAFEVDLTADDLQALDEIWPGPALPAPEAYASWHP